jgi:hypothetical protein
MGLYAQSPDESNFSYKNGLEFNFNNGAYTFQIGGFIQPAYRFETYDSLSQINRGLDKANAHYLNAKRTYFQLSGKAVEEKVQFFIQTDFSDQRPLLDAWIAYQPTQNLTITFGQKQTFTNNREMSFREDRLQFNNRGILSELMSRSGREFGLFV